MVCQLQTLWLAQQIFIFTFWKQKSELQSAGWLLLWALRNGSVSGSLLGLQMAEFSQGHYVVFSLCAFVSRFIVFRRKLVLQKKGTPE